jgi:hypothetical protein
MLFSCKAHWTLLQTQWTRKTHKKRPLLVSLFIPTATAAGVVGVALLHFSLRLLYISQMKRTFAGIAAVTGTGDDMAASPQWSKSSRQESRRRWGWHDHQSNTQILPSWRLLLRDPDACSGRGFLIRLLWMWLCTMQVSAGLTLARETFATHVI